MFVSITIFSGCRSEPPTEQVTVSAEVKSIVSKYLSAEQNNNYSYIGTLLTGEAFGEASLNFNRKQARKEYLNINLDEEIITPELATVYADITAKFSELSFNDRYALNFYLIQEKGRWLIYKTELVDLKRPVLSTGEIPTVAKKMLEDYFSLPYELKRYHEMDYLTGQALNVSSQVLNYCRQNPPPAATSKGFKVQKIKGMGCSQGYCITLITYSGGNNNTEITAVVDLVDVGGQWKICRSDIIGQEGRN